MKKILTTGLFGTILGLVTYNNAFASIVSRGFLDEQLANYATTKELDTKATQVDFTNLSRRIGDADWTTNLPEIAHELFPTLPKDANLKGISLSELLFHHTFNVLEFPGAAGYANQLLNGWTDAKGNLINPGLKGMYNGWTDSTGTTYTGLKELSERIGTSWGVIPLTEIVKSNVAKIGTLPDGYATVGDALTAINAKVDNKIENLSETASAGKYVLTAVKVGDQTTYAWELIDRSDNETTTATE